MSNPRRPISSAGPERRDQEPELRSVDEEIESAATKNDATDGGGATG
jgi:hypothetical protein